MVLGHHQQCDHHPHHLPGEGRKRLTACSAPGLQNRPQVPLFCGEIALLPHPRSLQWLRKGIKKGNRTFLCGNNAELLLLHHTESPPLPLPSQESHSQIIPTPKPGISAGGTQVGAARLKFFGFDWIRNESRGICF